MLPKRDENGNLPPEVVPAKAVAPGAPAARPGRTPEAALGPAIAGTHPQRGLADTETGDGDKISRDAEG